MKKIFIAGASGFIGKNLLKDKSSNSLMALGAMEVHLNMALQALNVFNKDSQE